VASAAASWPIPAIGRSFGIETGPRATRSQVVRATGVQRIVFVVVLVGGLASPGPSSEAVVGGVVSMATWWMFVPGGVFSAMIEAVPSGFSLAVTWPASSLRK